MNSISENSTKIKVTLIFTGSHTGNKGALEHIYFRNDIGCAYWSRCAKETKYGVHLCDIPMLLFPCLPHGK